MTRDITSLVMHARLLSGLHPKLLVSYSKEGLRFSVDVSHKNFASGDAPEGIQINPLQDGMFQITYFSTTQKSFDTLLRQEYNETIESSYYLKHLRDKAIALKKRYRPDPGGVHLVVEGKDALCSYEEAIGILDFFYRVSQDKNPNRPRGSGYF